MTLLDELLATAAFAGVGLLLMAIGFYMVELLTPGHLGRQVFVEHRRDASLLLASSLFSISGIVAMSIFQADGDTWHNVLETGAFGLLGIALLGIAFVALDLLTPGKLGELVTDDSDDPAIWVAVSTQLGVGLIVVASLT